MVLKQQKKLQKTSYKDGQSALLCFVIVLSFIHVSSFVLVVVIVFNAYISLNK